ncbi:40s ribosomal protein s5-1 [Hordeum vulgare]|nr:40s ribosomal protein s5-1 [Hordeum vulgare]
MREGLFNIQDVQAPRKGGNEKARLATVEQDIFKCQGMVERGVSANHSMITEFIRGNKMDIRNVGEVLFKLKERTEHLQAQIYELQSQNYEYESRFKRMILAAAFRIMETRSSFYDGKHVP